MLVKKIFFNGDLVLCSHYTNNMFIKEKLKKEKRSRKGNHPESHCPKHSYYLGMLSSSQLLWAAGTLF